MIYLNDVSLEIPVYGLEKQVFRRELVRIATGGFLRKNEQKTVTIKALNSLSLSFSEGDRIGLIGHNGAGKTSFLRLLNGVYEPTSGYLHIEGKVAALLDIMFGINEESTGYENIFLRGLLKGLTAKEIGKKKEAIANFTGLGDYLWMPVRTYSSGMKLRLAFAIATSIDPEIFLIDEVVGVGDHSFQEQAQDRMHEMIKKSSIVFLASHDSSVIEEVCNKVLWLDKGKVHFYGDVKEGIPLYKKTVGA